MKSTLRLPLLSLLATASLALAQSPTAKPDTPTSTFDPRITFAPLTLPGPVNAYRSSNGAPGPSYWQNEADYEMHASIDTEKKILTNSEIITYTNNSPDTLTSLWIHLEQNTYREDSRSHNLGSPVGGERRTRPGGAPARERGERGTTNGIEFDSVQIEDAPGHLTKADYVVADTRMQVRLAKPLAPKGGHLRIHIKYHYTIPGVWGGRTSWGKAEHGEIYDMAQWYPRMCVYDDIRGWDTLPYIGSEFYLEYGHFDYYVTVPWNFIVAGSGELMNESDVLTKTEIARLEQARHSDATVYIRKPDETTDPASRPKQSGTLTWHFHMDHTRDVVFSASPTFVWDAARMNVKREGLPNQLAPGKVQLAMSVYPVESVGDDAWTKSTEYVKDTVENMSKRWYPYPYPNAISVAGFSTGMEYPGVVFDGIHDNGSFLFWVTAHEIGHDWFPMIVGSNERRYAFMDEGFNTFIDIFESEDYAHGKYGPKRDSEYSAGGEPPDTILKVLDNPIAPPILTRADGFPGNLGHPVQYFKGAYGNVLLREQILGPERFDWAFRKYIRDWAFKHPRPSDFFREMESEGGEDLSYFWRGWYMNNWTLDLAVENAKYVGDDPTKGVIVTVANLRPLVLPATLQVNYKDGTNERIRIPVEAWLSKGVANFTFHGDKPVTTVVIDPDHVLPDDNRTNNTFTLP
ncbi:M1 family peptidase [Granulicella sp. 5B5]|uniref:M1 family metallopeptidase n=1 Tax=Granulicella sp. 5B5 TaxID=1617967 RepID=UPI0015F73569|nr:M1 family metallopeptidase [Granulicella sp. 5B5]QMV18258.1 M1 family peptidase [Granulicella sp. 5B5]